MIQNIIITIYDYDNHKENQGLTSFQFWAAKDKLSEQLPVI